MAATRKPLTEQVLVITGASSGIGLATALLAARRGARVVLAARDEEGLRRAAAQIRAEGGVCATVAADVAEPDDVQAIADAALSEFDGFDTWVNNAGVSIFGRVTEVPLDDAHRLFDTNYWGMVHGCLTAVPYLRRSGGTIINVGSAVSDRAIPLQGHYSASKHAIKGFTDALRMELEEEGAPIAVTLVKPASIDTPFPDHARNYMEVEPTLPPPVYDTEIVAEAIVACAERPRREVVVGGGGRMISAMVTVAPRLADRYMETAIFQQQRTDRPARHGRGDNLWDGLSQGETRGRYEGHVMRSSAYTGASLHPGLTALAVVGAGVGLAFALGAGRTRGAASAGGASPCTGSAGPRGRGRGRRGRGRWPGGASGPGRGPFPPPPR